MNRQVVAFAVAPLWVPLLVTPYSRLFLFPYPEQGHWVAIAAILSAVFSYGGVFLLGIPAFLILRSLNLTAVWVAGVVGFVVGAIVWMSFSILLVLFLNEGRLDLADAVQQATANPDKLTFGLWPGSIGAIVGLTLWLIARPDRQIR